MIFFFKSLVVVLTIRTCQTFLADSFESLAPLFPPFTFFAALALREPAAEQARPFIWLDAALACSFNTLTLLLAFEQQKHKDDKLILVLMTS